MENFKKSIFETIKYDYPEIKIKEETIAKILKYLKNYYDKFSKNNIDLNRIKPQIINFLVSYPNIEKMKSIEILRFIIGNKAVDQSIAEIEGPIELDDFYDTVDLDYDIVTPITDTSNINMEEVDGGRRKTKRRKTKRRKTKRRKTKRRKTKRRQRK